MEKKKTRGDLKRTYLTNASKYGDILVVALTDDKFVNKGPFRPYFNVNERAEFLLNLKVVDYIIINNEISPIEIISKLSEYDNTV